ncbi:conserved hypothetical protein [uncultured Sporomusa sp.]|uniref:Uncharacterized protein n=1 Tax=uncultured Sporomusa sp. TaxID=307249 RepID=A0A212LZT0_9FIRM|nr:conserved hypothetical protein [uncultured Sporomusa sp.]
MPNGWRRKPKLTNRAKEDCLTSLPSKQLMHIQKYGKNWAVYDGNGALICLTVYKRGAMEVLRRLKEINTDTKGEPINGLGDSTGDPGNCP